MGRTAGRPSSLTEKDWAAIGARLLAGEKTTDLAKEFKVGKSTISGRFSGINGNIKSVANQILATEAAVKALPISAQIQVFDLADQLRSISMHIAGAARYGACTAHRLSGVANAKVQLIDDADPINEKSMETLKAVAVLTKMANEASVIPMGLLAANKEAVANISKPQDEVKAVLVVPGLAANPDAWVASMSSNE